MSKAFCSECNEIYHISSMWKIYGNFVCKACIKKNADKEYPAVSEEELKASWEKIKKFYLG